MTSDTTGKNQKAQTTPAPRRFTSQQEAFFKSDTAIQAKAELTLMFDDPGYNTLGTFSINYSGHTIPFVERHMKYLSEHPKLDSGQYLSNLKLMTRIKR